MPLSRSTRVLAPVVLVLLLVAGVALARCDMDPPTRTAAAVLASSGPAAPPPADELGPRAPATTVPPPPPTTVPASPVATTRRPRPTQPVQAAQRPAPAPATGAHFWRRLSNCESRYGADEGPYGGYFQMTASSWADGGGTGGWPHGSWEEQQVVAAAHAARSNPWKQWPLCWGRALGDDPQYD